MDELLKSVRLTDDLKLDIYKQGKRRKYALFHDENNTKSEKYDVSLSDDQVIEESLYVYNKRNNKIYEVIQDPYKNDVNSNNSEYIVTVNTTIDQTISDETPKSPTQSVPKNKLIIDGLPKEIKIKAKDNLIDINAFKLLNISGVYIGDDDKNKMVQRINVAVFQTVS
jgi:threonyl-tRNA synthetase